MPISLVRTRYANLALTFALFAAFLVSANGVLAKEKQETPSLLTVERIFASGEFSSPGFSGHWTDDGKAFLATRASKSGRGVDIVRFDPVAGVDEIMVDAALLVPEGTNSPLSIEGFTFSPDGGKVLIYTNTRRVWRVNSRGDYWVFDISNRSLHKLGGEDAKEATLMFAKFSPDSQRVAYVRERNIYVEDLVSREITQLTEAPTADIFNGTFDWVYEEEFSIRDGFRWSPDGRSIAYWRFDESDVPEFTMIDNLSDFYPKTIPFKYPKTGMTNAEVTVGVVDIATGEKTWIDLPGSKRDDYPARMDWAPVVNGKQELLIQQYNRRQNECRLFMASPIDGSVRLLFTETDDAWVDSFDQQTDWLGNGSAFTWLSERTGWRHAYLIDRVTGEQKQLTSGEFDVANLLKVDDAGHSLYFLACPESATRRDLYRVSLEGGEAVRVTPKKYTGWNQYDISPTCDRAIHRHSTINDPTSVQLVSLSKHETVLELGSAEELATKVQSLGLPEIELFQVDAGDGVLLDGYMIKPLGFNAKKKYPVLVYVYGEPAGQTVKDSWGGSSQLWHMMLAQKGYIVLSVDNRGTRCPRGREFRKSIYGKVGIVAPGDQAKALRALLAERPYMDADRIGIWGWSGGGSMSLHAIFRHGDLYKAAMAVAPVPNMRCYDTIYQERYMGLPTDFPENYREGSPITHAHKLQGDLLIVHGTGDDNCHYATIEQLVDELIRHDKPFTMMAYPNRTHSIRERPGTTVHLRKLLTRYLLEHVEPGAQ